MFKFIIIYLYIIFNSFQDERYSQKYHGIYVIFKEKVVGTEKPYRTMRRNTPEKRGFMRAAFYTLGCKVNQYETQVLIQQFSAYGYDIVDSSDAADVYIINSCTVTASGDKKTRQMIHRMKRNSPGAVVALTGCFPQAFPEEAQKMEEVDILVGAGEKKKVLEYVNQYLRDGKRIVKITPHTKEERFEEMKADSFLERTRAFVKIQDGCEHYCSYCIIPYARGFNRSKSLEDLKMELYDLSAKGYKEVVLVGIDLSSYGKDIGCHLVDAVTLACTTEGIERVRLGSLEPLMLTDKNLEILASLPKFCPQFHLSLQSGCDATLKRMNRHYDTAFYRDLVARIRTKFDNPSITTDIMVGFPGETEEEFEDTISLIEKVRYDALFTFIFSPRGGTPAAKMEDPTPKEEKSRRFDRLCTVQNRISQEIHQGYVGKTMKVLVDGREGDNLTARTEGGRLVRLPGPDSLIGQFINARITGCTTWSLVGEVSD